MRPQPDAARIPRAKIVVRRRVPTTDVTRGLLQGIARATLSDEGVAACEVSVLLTDDDEIRTLNQTWRGVDKPTDVLSFPLHDAPREEVARAVASGADLLTLGDVVISLDTARREAVERGVSLDDVMAHLMAHGVLHLLGYDHVDRVEEADMRARESRTLQRLRRRPVMWDGGPA